MQSPTVAAATCSGGEGGHKTRACGASTLANSPATTTFKQQQQQQRQQQQIWQTKKQQHRLQDQFNHRPPHPIFSTQFGISTLAALLSMTITNIFLKSLHVLFVANSYRLFEMPVCISWLSTLLNTFKLPSCKYKAYRKWAITRQRTCMFEGIVQPTQTLRQDQNRLKISQTCQ